MTTLKVPSALRNYTNGEKFVEVSGHTVQTALRDLVSRYPGLKEHLYTPGGDLRPYVNIYLNGEEIRGRDGEAIPLAEKDRLMIVPSIAGGIGWRAQ
jgi:molybdopterin converting factor small subunit